MWQVWRTLVPGSPGFPPGEDALDVADVVHQANSRVGRGDCNQDLKSQQSDLCPSGGVHVFTIGRTGRGFTTQTRKPSIPGGHRPHSWGGAPHCPLVVKEWKKRPDAGTALTSMSSERAVTLTKWWRALHRAVNQRGAQPYRGAPPPPVTTYRTPRIRLDAK